MLLSSLKSTVLLTLLALVFACNENETKPGFVECESLSAEINFVVPDSMLQVIVTGGTAPYSYGWNDGSSESKFSGTISGLYEVTVTDALGCTAEASLVAASDCVLNLTDWQFEETTNTGIFLYTIDASSNAPPVTFLWSTGETGNSIQITEAGRYVASVTDANGCLIGYSSTINEGPQGLCEFGVRIYHSPSEDKLRISFDNLSSGGPYTYLWSDGSTERTLNNPVPGSNYMVTVTDASGCPAVGEISL